MAIYRRYLLLYVLVLYLLLFLMTARPAQANAGAPVLESAQAVTSNQVVLLWSGGNGVDTFLIERRTGSGAFSAVTLPLPADAATYSDTTVLTNVTYQYRITTSGGLSSETKSVTVMAAPTNLLAGTADGLSVSLTWTDTSGIAGLYEVYRKDGSNPFAYLQTVGSTTFTDINIEQNVTYQYQVRKVNANGDSSSFSSATGVTQLPALSALTVSNLKENSVTLNWTYSGDNISGFKIERKTHTGSFREIYTAPANFRSYTDTGLSQDTVYTYRVRAFTGTLDSPAREITIQTLLVKPSAPTGLKATALNKDRVLLEWVNTSTNVEKIVITRKTGTGTAEEIRTYSGGTATTYTDTGLHANTSYTYQIIAENRAGSSLSNTVTIKTPAGDLPQPPNNLRETEVKKDSITLSWRDNSNNETGFKIERKTGTGNFTQVGTTLANVTTFTNDKLSNNTTYIYRVRAYNSFGDSPYTDELTVTTGETPAAPTDLTFTSVSRNSITISWKDNAGDESGFRIERKTGSGSYTQIATVGANVTSYTNTGLTANNTYHYRVRAYNSVGNSAFSNEITAVATDQPPAPSDLRITAGSGGSVTLNWKDNAPNETGFRIERKTGVGEYTQIASVGANVTTYTNTGLVANALYHYRVRAYNGAGNSPYSNEASFILARDPVTLTLTVGRSTYLVNQQQKTMDAAPIVQDGRTLLPFRYVAEAIGAQVHWDAATEKVTLTLGERRVELWINKNMARVNGVEKYIDPDNRSVTPIVVPPGRTMLPLRFIAENLGAGVGWDAKTQQITVTYK